MNSDLLKFQVVNITVQSKWVLHAVFWGFFVIRLHAEPIIQEWSSGLSNHQLEAFSLRITITEMLHHAG